jgi:hypothetical protein
MAQKNARKSRNFCTKRPLLIHSTRLTLRTALPVPTVPIITKCVCYILNTRLLVGYLMPYEGRKIHFILSTWKYSNRMVISTVNLVF